MTGVFGTLVNLTGFVQPGDPVAAVLLTVLSVVAWLCIAVARGAGLLITWYLVRSVRRLAREARPAAAAA